MPDFTTTVASTTSTIALKMARRRLADVDTAHVYDAFTISLMMLLEDIGFCAKGEGVAFVEAGNIALGGSIALNTNGGGLAFTHPGMLGMFSLTEAVTQLRGDAGARQKEGATTSLVHGTARHGTARDGADGGGPQHGRSFDRIGAALSVPAPHRHGVRRHAMDGAASMTRQLSGAPQHCSSHPKLNQ